MAEIFRAHWPAYLAKFGPLIPPEQCAAARAWRRCRTPVLGGQLYGCACGQRHYSYHSCNHRACPKCGFDDNAAWLASQLTRLLPVPYFLVTSTVPAELRPPVRSAMKLWYGALLKESAAALQDLAAQPKYLGAQLGLLSVLQTWTRQLHYHPHVHVLVPGGGLSPEGLRWVRVKDAQYFLPQVKLAARFKGRLRAWLKKEHPQLLAGVPAKVWSIPWVADVQAVGSGAAALQYLAHYVSRGPLHPARITAWDGQQVTFRYRDSHGAPQRCTLSPFEFLRRLLQHVPPKGFQRVRHYGWRAGAAAAKWQRTLALLDWCAPALGPPTPRPVLCAHCGQVMQLIATLARAPP